MLFGRTTLAALLLVDVALFVIAAIVGQHPDEHWKDVVGAIGWYGFLICTLVLIVVALVWMAQKLRGRRASSS